MTEDMLAEINTHELCCGKPISISSESSTSSSNSCASPTLDAFLSYSSHRVDTALQHLLPSQTTTPERLHEAMHYVIFAKGKRIRPALVYAVAEMFRGQVVDQKALDAAACAVELIHAYSLVHDDLPAMDNDDLRRGQPTCHKKYDEATAILVGDALQALAFEAIADYPQMVRELARASGSRGMVGGQAIDIASEGITLTEPELNNLHSLKTGALIKASIALGAIACGCNPTSATYTTLMTFADNIGLAFQVQDDILDIEGDDTLLGKKIGQDLLLDKSTYPKLLGLEQAKALTSKLETTALTALSTISTNTTTLKNLARFIVKRKS